MASVIEFACERCTGPRAVPDQGASTLQMMGLTLVAGLSGSCPRHDAVTSSAGSGARDSGHRGHDDHLDNVVVEFHSGHAAGPGVCLASLLAQPSSAHCQRWRSRAGSSRAFPLRPRIAGALYGLGAGLMADAGWRLFCHFSNPAHVFGAHHDRPRHVPSWDGVNFPARHVTGSGGICSPDLLTSC